MQNAEKMNTKRIFEIKENGPETVTEEDIPMALDLIKELVNVNPEIQEMVKELDISGVIDVTDLEATYTMTIKDGKCDYATGELDSTNFRLETDLVTITKILLGELDAVNAFFSEVIYVEGELYQMLLFTEILEKALEVMKITEERNKATTIEISKMKEILKIYQEGGKNIEASHIPLYFKVLEIFANQNPDAQEEMEDVDLTVKMSVEDVGDYYMKIEDCKMVTSSEPFDDVSLSISMDKDTIGELITSGDAVSAYMSGDIEVEGEIAQALAFQQLVEFLLDVLELA